MYFVKRSALADAHANLGHAAEADVIRNEAERGLRR